MKLCTYAPVNPPDLLDKDSSDDESIVEMLDLFTCNASKDIDKVSSSDDEYSTTDSISI